MKMTEPYKKVGRGGAGNFYSKKDVQDVVQAGEAVSLIFPILASSNCKCRKIEC